MGRPQIDDLNTTTAITTTTLHYAKEQEHEQEQDLSDDSLGETLRSSAASIDASTTDTTTENTNITNTTNTTSTTTPTPLTKGPPLNTTKTPLSNRSFSHRSILEIEDMDLNSCNASHAGDYDYENLSRHQAASTIFEDFFAREPDNKARGADIANYLKQCKGLEF